MNMRADSNGVGRFFKISESRIICIMLNNMNHPNQTTSVSSNPSFQHSTDLIYCSDDVGSAGLLFYVRV